MRIKRGLAGMASIGAVLVVGALAPTTAMAHPCISEVNAALGKTLTLHSGGSWAGYLPAFSEEHNCVEDFSSEGYQVNETGDAAADPIGDAVSTFTYTFDPPRPRMRCLHP
jgi:hypothetical protein